VVDPDLHVHDTPGLYVFGTAVFPTCPGVNPTLTMFALGRRAGQRVARRESRKVALLIDRIETALYRLPLDLEEAGSVGDAGHGVLQHEELITVEVHADGVVGHG
jgi:hypothetical protein